MSDKYNVKITEYAQHQIEVIYQYIYLELQSPEVADRWLNYINNEIQKSLSFMPTRIKTIEEEPWGSEGIRKVILKNYYVYFWLDNSTEEVWVMAVVYSRRNQQEQLKSMVSE